MNQNSKTLLIHPSSFILHPSDLLLSWRDRVTASADGEGTLVVQGPGARVSLRQVPVPILEAFRRLDPPGLDPDRLREFIQGNGDGAPAHWYYYLERLTRPGLVCYTAPARWHCPA